MGPISHGFIGSNECIGLFNGPRSIRFNGPKLFDKIMDQKQMQMVKYLIIIIGDKIIYLMV